MYRKYMAMLVLMGMLLLPAGRGLAAGVKPSVPVTKTDAASAKAKSTNAGIASYDPGQRVAESDEEFVLDNHYALDQYTFRSGGPITFPINVTRYFGPVDGAGHLLHPENIEGRTAQLTLRVWDVDQNGGGPGWAPEVDEVYVNGNKVGVLTGADSQWSTFTVSIPVEQLYFPNVVNGIVGSVENQISIYIDTANVGNCECWAVEVDWGRLVIKGVRPAVLVHGFMSDESTWSAWVNNYAANAGLPVYAFSFTNNHASWITHAQELAQEIDAAKRRFGVDKVNIVGHSKGGLDSRAYLALTGRTDVVRLVMMGTPNGGSPLADLAKTAGLAGGVIGSVLVSAIADPALTELTPAYMTIGNLLIGQNPATDYYTIAGNWSDGWIIDGNPLIWGQDDGVVAISSVETLPYTTNLGHTTSFHTDMTSGAGEWALARGQVMRTSGGLTPASGGADLMPPISSLQVETVPGGGTQSHAIHLEAGAPAVIGILWGTGPLTLTVTGPDGAPLTNGAGGVEVVTSQDDSVGLAFSFYRVTSPQTGSYTLHVASAAATDTNYAVIKAVEAAPRLTVAPASAVVAGGTPAVLTATLDWEGLPALPMQAEAKIQQPDGTVATVALLDDGLGQDAAAGDSIYTGSYLPAGEGFHYVAVTASSGSGLQRVASSGFQVLSGQDHFTAVTGHHGGDLDGDGFYDSLAVEIGVAVQTPGTYTVTGRLTDTAGRTLVRSGTELNLPAGSSTVALQFDGGLLGDSGFTGDLVLADLTLLRKTGGLADYRAAAGTLSGYSAEQFRQQPIRILAGITDQATDLDGNGRFDRLTVTIPISLTTAASYNINARLMDSAGQEIAWTGQTRSLPAGNVSVTLSYDGMTIGQHGVNGPYKVRDFSMYNRSTGRGVNVVDLHTTQPYLVSQFEGAVTDTAPPVWPPGSALTATGVTGSGLTLTWTAAGDDVGVAEYRIFQDGTLIGTTDGATRTLAVSGLRNSTTYTFRVEAADQAGNVSTGGPTVSATTGGPSLLFLAPLDPNATVKVPANSVLPIRFQWLVDGQPTLDTSVSIRIRDAAGRLVTGFTYGNGITYDPATGQYLQEFLPSRYGQGPGASLRIMVYVGSKLRASASVTLE